MKYKILGYFFILFSSVCFAQEQKVTRHKLLNFEYLHVTRGEVKENLPLLIAFHYSGGNPTETLDDYNQLEGTVRIIIPQGNYKKRTGFSYYPADYYQKDSVTQYAIALHTLDSIASFVAAIEKKFTTIAVVSGISQGGDLSFLLAKHFPNLCRASFPFAAVIHSAVNKELGEKAVKKVPIYIYQGEKDPIIPYMVTRQKVQDIGKKLNIKLFTYPNVGHEISPEMKNDYSKLMNGYLKN